MRTKILLLALISTFTVFAQEKVQEEILEEGQFTVEIGEAEEVKDAKIEPLTFNENKEMTSFLVKRPGQNPLIIGMGERKVAIINAYAGAQAFFGVKAGIDLFDTLEFGVQATNSPGGTSDNPISVGKSRTGFHANLKIYPFKNHPFDPCFYFGGTYTDIQRRRIAPGYYHTIETGKVVGGHIGIRIDQLKEGNENSRHRIGIEIGYEKSLNGLDKYEYNLDGAPISTGHSYAMPTFNLNYTIRLFK
ncbi:MAG: hypothetical protein ACOYL6_08835 [Bacteriovoracaceae bacterium]